MANRKISDLTALTAPATGDLLPIVDISEAAAADKNKKITIEKLFQGIPGNVGIGTSSPNEKLEVAGGIRASGALLTGSANSIAIDYSTNARIVSYGANTSTQGGFVFLGANSNASTSLERLRIDSSGRILVGTSSTSANSTLVLQGASGSSNAIIRPCLSNSSPGTEDQIGMIAFGDSSQRDLAYFFCARDSGTWTAGSSQPTRLVFSTTADGAASPAERMRITSAGRFNNVSTEAGIFSETTQAAGTSFVVFQGRYSATAGSPLSGTTSFQVYSNGNVQNTNNSYGAISDLKLKENIVDAGSQWADLKALQVRKYNFKEGQTHTQIGLVAQEVELVSPGLVSESPDRDEEGNDLGTVTKSVNYSVLYMKAVKALQEAMERIETLETRLSALEGA